MLPITSSRCVSLYEDLDENYEQTMRSVLTFLGVDGSIPAPPLKKQSDATTESWVELFNGYFRGRRLSGSVVRLISRRW